MRNIIYLILASGAGQLITVCVTPILSRIYSKDSFGALGVVVAVSNVLAIIISLRTEHLMMQSDVKDAEKYLNGSLLVIFTNGVVISIVLIFAWFFIDYDLAIGLASVAGGVSVAMFSTMRIYLNMQSSFSESGMLNITRSAGQAASQVILFPLSYGLVTGWVLGMYVSLLGSMRRNVSYIKYSELSVFKGKGLSVVKIATSALLSELAVSFLILAAYVSHGAEEAGIIVMVYRVIGFPVMLVARAVADYLMVTYKKIFDGEVGLNSLIIPYVFCVASSFILIVSSILVPEGWISALLGDEWSDIKSYFVILAPLFAVRLLSIVVSPLYIVSNNLSSYLAFTVVLLFGYVLVYLTSKFYFSGSEGVELVLSFSVFGFVIYTLYVAYGVRILWLKRKRKVIT